MSFWPEVQDKPHLKLSGFEVIEKLGFMLGHDSLGSFDLNDDRVINENIGKLLSDDHIVIEYADRMLGNSRESQFLQLDQ